MQDKQRVARAALSRLMEPSDTAGLALVSVAGPETALAVATGQTPGDAGLEREVARCLEEEGVGGGWTGLGPALRRWAPRVADLAPERDLDTAARLGGRYLVPEDELWPEALNDLGLMTPLGLWWRGAETPLPQARSCVAVVGSRDSTSYGASVTGELAHGLAQRGYSIVSGGAYGIDAHAHRAALAGGTSALPTIAVMACGVDRYYPAGNEDLLRTVAAQGALLAEVPPGSSPTRWRFLQRNRLIAALAGATVVVEARWRSGALNTAHHADSLSRPVGAVPGSVYSANSAGCHRLLREGSAVCVTDASEVAELVSPAGSALADEFGGHAARASDHDGLNLEDLLLLDALPVRAASSPEKLSTVAGLDVDTVLAGLGRLQLLGLAEASAGGWRRRKAAE
ncbi:DNA-processing protein DprA [Paenarthrobacter sp. DKR-5]|uniref:DNA-processing protein DprA n=1 Tax=Paenarthrobacter sp. DKR-5 TaxID=2835535 RepID=UPI001BDD9981|nr:DNA-processing protein DprA [Paenarthrobacter sp. DKR-5]MBT1003679.1 DNA-processing protein DprA [Paenarthrobacter sp. DKR-5]